MERLKMMKENIMSAIQGQMGNLQQANAEELGKAIDMVKDLSEATYYCSIVKAMEDREKNEKEKHYYYTPIDYNYYNENRYRNYSDYNRMYYNEDQPRDSQGRFRSNYNMNYPYEIRDYREGRSPVTRRNYMESKELHHTKEKQMEELEKYMNELNRDILEMINDATQEEKVMLSQKLSMLADKIK